jgi:phosphoglycerol transferase MdoB-like AlkP superfamily enzyme
MMWESYPIIWMMAALVLFVYLLRWIFLRTHIYVLTQTQGRGIRYHRTPFILTIILFAVFIYGGLSGQPLKWNNAFVLEDGFRSHLALNPLQNFFTTLRFRKPQVNESEAKNFFPVMKEWMDLENGSSSFIRSMPAGINAENKTNVVLVLCESFSMYKSSMSGNPLNTTPYFKDLTKEGVFFERCFSPHFSTARGLFATITGIPDVQLSKFSTRNELALDQHTIINEFGDHNKMYFLGGNPNFNNFAGLLQNIEGLQMITEGKFRSRPVNVWGISDKDLFLEANDYFKKQKDPFFAIIQTADNHRPFTIPEGEKEFRSISVHKDSLQKYGFESEDEFNAFRYSDYCIRKFMEAAKKEAYFSNTLFVFVGDHGVSGNAKSVYPEVWTRERLTEEHVPLLFYSPGLLAPSQRKEVVSQIDVLPSVAAITGQKFVNSTLGRDVVVHPPANNYAFIIHHDEGRIGMVTNDFYFTKNINFKKEELHYFSVPSHTAGNMDSLRNRMVAVTDGFYETAKWMLLNNKKHMVKAGNSND